MSDYTVIGAVSDTLLRVLREEIGLKDVQVVLASPADVELDQAPQLALFAYHMVENHTMKNQVPERVPKSQAGEYSLRTAPTVLDVYYLLAAYASTRENEYQILGKAMQILAARPVLRGSWLQGTLAGTDEEIQVIFHSLPLEELLRLWNTYTSQPYKLSASYLVPGVRLDTARPPIEVEPVVERQIRVTDP